MSYIGCSRYLIRKQTDKHTSYCLKNVNRPTLSCYNFNTREPTEIVFGRNAAEKVSNQKTHYFPTSPNLCLALPGETGNPEIASVHLNAAYGFANKHMKHIKISPVTAEPPFTVKTIDRVHETGRIGREQSILQYITLTLDVYQVCHSDGPCIRNRSCSSLRLEWKSKDSITTISYCLPARHCTSPSSV